MKYKFELEIECESLADITDLLEHVKNRIYEGKKFGGESSGDHWGCGTYDWSIEKKEEDDEH